MRRYIDAEWLKELYQPYESYNGKELAVPIGAILANIDDAPSIDICFCRECKHWNKAPNTERGWCDECDGLLEPNFFCGDGAKESE